MARISLQTPTEKHLGVIIRALLDSIMEGEGHIQWMFPVKKAHGYMGLSDTRLYVLVGKGTVPSVPADPGNEKSDRLITLGAMIEYVIWLERYHQRGEAV